VLSPPSSRLLPSSIPSGRFLILCPSFVSHLMSFPYLPFLSSAISSCQPLLDVIKVWETSLNEELDFRVEAKNMLEAQRDMSKAGFGTSIPEPVRGYIHPKVMVMTRLRGFKVSRPIPSVSSSFLKRTSLVCLLVCGCCADH
jgi:hypothetical protein